MLFDNHDEWSLLAHGDAEEHSAWETLEAGGTAEEERSSFAWPLHYLPTPAKRTYPQVQLNCGR